MERHARKGFSHMRDGIADLLMRSAAACNLRKKQKSAITYKMVTECPRPTSHPLQDDGIAAMTRTSWRALWQFAAGVRAVPAAAGSAAAPTAHG